jgi:multiple sugar transport system ATP-binding protein
VPGLVLENVSKWYGPVEAVPEINLEIQDKEFAILVGPSGCGKSTVLRMIAGLETPTRGRILLDNVDITARAPKDRNMAMVFQDYALYPHMSVYENMAFSLTLRKVPKAQITRAVQEAAGILGLEGLLQRRPGELSGGQRQRVALGRAELIRLHRRLQTTSIFVTHDQVEAMTMGTKIVVMKDGIVQQVGNPIDVYNEPINRFVAGFIGSPRMNFFNARLLRADDGLAVDCGAFRLRLPPEQWPCSDARLGDAIFAIRPADISITPIGKADGNSITATVELAEPLGAQTHLYCRVADLEFLADIPLQLRLVAGSSVNLTFDLARAHLFEATPEGRRIPTRPVEIASALAFTANP